jgi:hypothetical protein
MHTKLQRCFDCHVEHALAFKQQILCNKSNRVENACLYHFRRSLVAMLDFSRSGFAQRVPRRYRRKIAPNELHDGC